MTMPYCQRLLCTYVTFIVVFVILLSTSHVFLIEREEQETSLVSILALLT